MGVDYVTYLQLGVRFDGIPDLADKLQDADCDLAVVDGMCGDYSIIGPVLASADNQDAGDIISIDTSTDVLDKAWESYKEKFIDSVGAELWDDDWKPKLMFYVHAW